MNATDTIIENRKKTYVITVNLLLKRNITPLLLNTYLPTFILTVINQLTNYFIGFDMFEGIITINATVLMTLASLFISVFNSMPQTTYVKMMDIWMIVTFVYPFIIIFLHTVVHVMNKRNKGTKHTDPRIRFLMRCSQAVLPLLFIIFSVVYWIIGMGKYVNN